MRVNLPVARSWLKNLWKAHVQHQRQLEPLGITWHSTNQCNFKCTFCDDGKGNRYPDLKSYTMTTEEVKQVLALAREKVSILYITGGEPFLRKDLAEIVRWAKEEAGYLYVGMVTNGVLIHRNESVLDYLDDLAISLHSLDDQRGDQLINRGPGSNKEVIEAILRYGPTASERGYRFNVSGVVLADCINDAREVMHFCFEHGLPYAVMPQSVTPYPHPELVNNREYIRFIDEVIECKRKGQPVWGSYAYLRTIRDFTKFNCYPTTVPRIFPNGDLVYPCSPLNTIAGNLIGAESFDAVMAQGIAKHGAVPKCDTRCFASCYIETSYIIEFPAVITWEHLDFWSRIRQLTAGVGVKKHISSPLPGA